MICLPSTSLLCKSSPLYKEIITIGIVKDAELLEASPAIERKHSIPGSTVNPVTFFFFEKEKEKEKRNELKRKKRITYK